MLAQQGWQVDAVELIEHNIRIFERSTLTVEPLQLVAADGMSHHIRETLAAMDEAAFAHYLNYHFATCERRELLGWSNHVLDIFSKQ